MLLVVATRIATHFDAIGAPGLSFDSTVGAVDADAAFFSVLAFLTARCRRRSLSSSGVRRARLGFFVLPALLGFVADGAGSRVGRALRDFTGLALGVGSA